MISRRGFIAALLALPIVAKLEPIAKAIFPRLPGRLGVKGREFLEAGYIWVPYIPVVVTPIFLDPSDYPKETLTRYAGKKLRTDYYGKVEF